MKRLSAHSQSNLLISIAVAACFVLLAVSASAIVDSNNNGVSDIWEKQFNNAELFPSSFDPLADPDGDGWNNAKEAAAGSNPFDPIPPDGYLRPAFAHSPETWTDLDGDGTVEHTPEAVTLTWVTIPGKLYTLQYSFDLAEESWFPIGEQFVGNGNEVERGFPITESEGIRPDKNFWRVAVTDTDTDGDNLTDHEENHLDTDPQSADSDQDGVTDFEEIQQGTNPHIPRIWGFREMTNLDGTVTYTWNSHAENGDWFHIEKLQPDNSWKTVYSTTYGSTTLPYITGLVSYSLTLDPATDYLP